MKITPIVVLLLLSSIAFAQSDSVTVNPLVADTSSQPMLTSVAPVAVTSTVSTDMSATSTQTVTAKKARMPIKTDYSLESMMSKRGDGRVPGSRKATQVKYDPSLYSKTKSKVVSKSSAVAVPTVTQKSESKAPLIVKAPKKASGGEVVLAANRCKLTSFGCAQ